MPQKNLNVLVDKDLREAAKIAAIKKGTTISKVVRAALIELAYGESHAAATTDLPHKEKSHD